MSQASLAGRVRSAVRPRRTLARFAVVDVETTGLDPAVDRVVEIAIIHLAADGRVRDEFASLVAVPELSCTPIHGITEADLSDAPAFVQIAEEIRRRLTGGVVIVGHNVAFDLAFVDAELARAGVTRPSGHSLCTIALGRALGLERERVNLAMACERRGIGAWRRHSALGDARATSRLLVSYGGATERNR